ncbi:MAG: caspase family protein, partial [Polyangiales bacterium]
MIRTLAFVLLMLVPGLARAEPLRRFALGVSANDGGPAREKLRFAEGDAQALLEVLQQLGGVEPRDARHLVQPSADGLRAAFAELARQLAGQRTEVIFYYSGHSDESGLLLGRDRVSYAALRQLLQELPTQVRIAILDSCASGGFTREKGGTARPPFIVDSSTDVRGHAFLTSSSADEAAQESDRIGGSFFTHYLVSGLRGAADSSGDRKITLTEAYRFAFEETLARTTPTQFGSQHPAYEIRLAGTGDLVMTDLRTATAELTLDESVDGRLFVWEPPRKLLVEVDKPPGRALVLALPANSYRLELSRGAHYYVADVQALAGRPQRVNKALFRGVEREATLARGVIEQFADAPFGAGIIPPFATNQRLRTRLQRPVRNRVNVSLLYDDPDAVAGLQLGFFGVSARRYLHGYQFGTFFNDAGELLGMQMSFVANAVRSYGYGLQLAGVANYASRELRGLQASALINHVETLRGVQSAFGLNMVREHLHGLQLGGINWSKAGEGAQLGGLNLARDLTGLQLGFVNVAAGRVHGMQVGLLNYADEADVSLAPLGITRQGGVHPEVSVDELMAPFLALRLEAKYNYSFVSLALAPYAGGASGYAVGAGLGAKTPLPLEG